jgi:hypothetical protein
VVALSAGPWTSILWPSFSPRHSSSQNYSHFISSYLQHFSFSIHQHWTCWLRQTFEMYQNYVVHNLFLGFWYNRRLASLRHSISLAVSMKQHESHRTDLCEISNLWSQSDFWLRSDKSNRHCWCVYDNTSPWLDTVWHRQTAICMTYEMTN